MGLLEFRARLSRLFSLRAPEPSSKLARLEVPRGVLVPRAATWGAQPQLTARPQSEGFASPAPKPVDPLLAKLTSRESLEKLYGDVWPGMRLEIHPQDSSGLRHHVSWFDGEKRVGFANLSLARASDGSLNAFGGGARIDPAYRGQGVVNRMVPKVAAWLREASPHPNTSITLGAGAAGGEKMGPYIWANFGFDFANIHRDRVEIREFTTARAMYGERPEPPIFRKAFAEWLDALRKKGQLPDDDELMAHLKDASEQWQHSWDVANFDVPGLRVDMTIRGRKVKWPLGKAFLMDPHSPTWAGVFFVNDLNSTGAKIQAAYSRGGVGHRKGEET
jgi:hypothetical protein